MLITYDSVFHFATNTRMIDTVIFKIHDLKLHEPLCYYLNSKITNSGFSVKMVTDDSDFSEPVKRNFKTVLHYHDTGNSMEKADFRKLKSSHYEIAFCIDYHNDCITFNLSIPKYFYGTNVLHTNTPPNHPKFNFFEHNTLKKNFSEAYNKLQQFFEHFFINEFGTINIYRSYVEINRIDLCYNQVF